MVSLEGKIAVVTGAGRGSGAGEGSDAIVARQVVNEIKNAALRYHAFDDGTAPMLAFPALSPGQASRR